MQKKKLGLTTIDPSHGRRILCLERKSQKLGTVKFQGWNAKKNDRQLNSSQQNCSIELKAKLMYNQLKETIDVEEAT